MFSKKSMLLAILISCLAVLWAKEEEAFESRNIYQFGFSVVKGFNTDWAQLGTGLVLQELIYIDTSSPEGWFFSIFSINFLPLSNVGGITILDCSPFTLGWRGNPLLWFDNSTRLFELEMSIFPTVGLRVQDSTSLLNWNIGLGLNLGIYFNRLKDNDLGIAFEPIIPFEIGNNKIVPNHGYLDIALKWTMKTHTVTNSLPWID